MSGSCYQLYTEDGPPPGSPGELLDRGLAVRVGRGRVVAAVVAVVEVPAERYRSPGVLIGYSDTGIDRSSAVRTIRDCSATWAAG